jgi:hypothetical protein
MGLLRKDEYEMLRQFVDDARKKSEDARAALDNHIAEHGC